MFLRQGRAALPPAPLWPFALRAAQVPLVVGAEQVPPWVGGANVQGTPLQQVRVLESAKDLLSKNLNALLSLYQAFHLKCFTPFKGLNLAPRQVGRSCTAVIAPMAKLLSHTAPKRDTASFPLLSRTSRQYRPPLNPIFLEGSRQGHFPVGRDSRSRKSMGPSRGSFPPGLGKHSMAEAPACLEGQEKAEGFPQAPW